MPISIAGRSVLKGLEIAGFPAPYFFRNKYFDLSRKNAYQQLWRYYETYRRFKTVVERHDYWRRNQFGYLSNTGSSCYKLGTIAEAGAMTDLVVDKLDIPLNEMPSVFKAAGVKL